MRIFKRLLIFVLFAGALAGGYYLYNRYVSLPEEASYETAAVMRGSVRRTVTETGNITARETVAVYIKNTQTVKDVPVKEGDAVKSGDVLVRYDIADDIADLNRRLEQSRLNLANAELNLSAIGLPAEGNELVQLNSELTVAAKNIEDAEDDIRSLEIRISQQRLRLDDLIDLADKNEILYGGNAISKNEYDNTVTAKKNAEESLNDLLVQLEARQRSLELRRDQLDFAEQRLRNATNRLSDESNYIKYELQKNVVRLNQLEIEQLQEELDKYTETTYCPVNGNIVSIGVTPGGTAVRNNPVARISDSSDIRARMEISEYDAPMLKTGMRAEITAAGLPGTVFEGYIAKIAAEAVKKDASSDADIIVPVEVTVLNRDERLKIGYTVDITVIVAERRNALYVPVQTLTVREDGTYATVFDRESETAEAVRVETGLYGDRFVEILSGLNEGDEILME